ncbi:hypothetical protein NMD10_27745 (plasmid) [Citrobacter portucalensis]|uniref:hypothetical protein n=1 Tax=Citrobacter portucalensis TaxID=1639133 RepID=UPI00351CD510
MINEYIEVFDPSANSELLMKSVSALDRLAAQTKKDEAARIKHKEEELAKSIQFAAMMAELQQQYAFGLPHIPVRDATYIPVVSADTVGGNQFAKSLHANVQDLQLKRHARNLLAKSLNDMRDAQVPAATRVQIQQTCEAALNSNTIPANQVIKFLNGIGA